MAAMSEYLRNKLVEHSLGKTAYTMPDAVYLGLFLNDPTANATGTEVTGGSYVRRVMSFSPALAGGSQTTAEITYPQATGAWGTISHVGIYDALTGGNLLYFGPVDEAKTILTGDIFKIPAGSLGVLVN